MTFAIRERYAKLHLRLNESKSAVAPVQTRKFLGYYLYRWGGEVRRGVSVEAQRAFKDRVRQITRRVVGRSLPSVVNELNTYLRGWKGYFGRTQQVKLLGALDGWIRRRLRALQLKHWSRGPTIYRKLRIRGMQRDTAWSIACSPGGWWRRSLQLARHLPLAWFDSLGLVRLAT